MGNDKASIDMVLNVVVSHVDIFASSALRAAQSYLECRLVVYSEFGWFRFELA